LDGQGRIKGKGREKYRRAIHPQTRLGISVEGCHIVDTLVEIKTSIKGGGLRKIVQVLVWLTRQQKKMKWTKHTKKKGNLPELL
jgi:hypothetical protein